MLTEKENQLIILNYFTHALSDRGQIAYQIFLNFVNIKNDQENNHFQNNKNSSYLLLVHDIY